MGATTMERLQEQMQSLKLPRAAAELPGLVQDASKRDLTYVDFLQELVDRELVSMKNEK